MGGEETLLTFPFTLLCFVGLVCPSDDNKDKKNQKEKKKLLFSY